MSSQQYGNKHYITEIVASNIQMLGSKTKDTSESTEQEVNSDIPQDDDLPF